MTLANKITVLRIIAIPIFLIALFEHSLPVARMIFFISILTDALDGAMARMRGEQTLLGTFLDPVADKLLLLATYVAFTALSWIPVWVFIVVISRDLLLLIGWAVIYLLTGDYKIEPRHLGKATTASQMIFAMACLLNVPPVAAFPIRYLMVAITVASLLDYIWVGDKKLGIYS